MAKIEELISRALYEQLPEILKITTTRRTQIVNEPRKMVWDEITKLSEILNIPPWDLVHEYECGWRTLTIEDLNEYLQNLELFFNTDEEQEHE